MQHERSGAPVRKGTSGRGHRHLFGGLVSVVGKGLRGKGRWVRPAGFLFFSFAIDPLGLLEGSLPRRQLRLVLAWAELHQEELRENWQRVQNGQVPQQLGGI